MDRITPEERRLIDEAVAAGRVKKIPTGVSGIKGSAVDWRTQTKQSYALHKSKMRANRSVVAAIRNLASLGLSDAEIAKRMGRSRESVAGYRHRHGIEAGLKQGKRNGKS